MRILVTNDDGIESEGLHILARAAEKEGHDVFVIAPNFDASARNAHWVVITTRRGYLSQGKHLGSFRACAIDQWPSGFVRHSRSSRSAGEPPDLVLSGINPGKHGRSTLHGGTVGAVLTAQILVQRNRGESS